jgi:hypothetical protein
MKTYNIRFPIVTTLFLLAVLFGAHGCDRAMGPGNLEDDTALYEPPIDPDALVSNFIRVWEEMDIAAYGDHILYNGKLKSLDGKHYEPFTFYFIDYPQNPQQVQGYEAELANVGKMFSGDPGRGGNVPGIESVNLRLMKRQEWTDPAGDRVHGDPYPTGTKRCVFDVDLFIGLESEYVPRAGAAPMTGFTVTHRQEFYVIPVAVGEPGAAFTEYRMWKWQEMQR